MRAHHRPLVGEQPEGWLPHLHPADGLAEVLCGLIMVLTVTLATHRWERATDDGAQKVWLAALGCNLAWGTIDAVLYVMTRLASRGRTRKLAHDLRAMDGEDARVAHVRAALAPGLAPLADDAALESLYRSVARVAPTLAERRGHLTPGDLTGAVLVFALNVLAVVPVWMPFLVIADPWIAIRTSNGVLVALLFVVGCAWAHYAGTSRWLSGLSLMAVGLSLVATAIALGG